MTERSLTCTVMVLSWNSVQWLPRTLPSVLRAATVAGADVWVVENGDAMRTSDALRRWPSVTLMPTGCNKSLGAFNDAAFQCTSEVVVTLDADVAVDMGFLLPLLRHFRDAGDLLAVSPDIRHFPPGSQESNGEAQGASWRLGALRPGTVRPGTDTSQILYAHGGAAAWNRAKLLELEGFDSLYFPLYWEDIDLSWRGWKRGWRCLYEPSSIVYHAGGSAFGHASPKVRSLQVRNEFLFHWKNLDPSFLIFHALLLPLRLGNAVVRRDRARLTGFVRALPRVHVARRRRVAARSAFRRSDRDVLRAIG